MNIAPFAARVIAVLQGKYDQSGGRVSGKKMLQTTKRGPCGPLDGVRHPPPDDWIGLRVRRAGRSINGLLLRADIHRLYDSGYVTVTPDHRFRVSGDLVDDFHNGREYERFAGREIAVPRARADRPDAELLEWHGAEVFRG